jgi:Collagen triple helix repeat (20 copies)/BppU N-terminal domain
VSLGNTPHRQTNILLERNKSFALNLRFTKKDGTPYDLTGATVRLVAVEPEHWGGQTVITETAVLLVPKDGTAQFKFQASDLSLQDGEYAYDMTLLSVGNYSTPILKGTIVLGENADTDSTNVYSTITNSSELVVTFGTSHEVEVCLHYAEGFVGATGPTGPQGPKGDQGSTGATGATGATGPKGNTGATGATGPQGTQGPQGVIGNPGPKGDKGDKGDTGYTGAQGPQGNVAVGSTTTGAPGTMASVLDSDPSLGSAVLEFTIPRGDKGDRGMQGQPGVAASLSVEWVVGSGSNTTVDPGPTYMVWEQTGDLWYIAMSKTDSTGLVRRIEDLVLGSSMTFVLDRDGVAPVEMISTYVLVKAPVDNGTWVRYETQRVVFSGSSTPVPGDTLTVVAEFGSGNYYLTPTDGDGRYVNITGDTLTAGDLTLFRAPTSALHAATKAYVDSAIAAENAAGAAADALKVAKSGDNMTGNLTISHSTATTNLTLNGTDPVSKYPQLNWQNNGSHRWQLRSTGAETGSDAGSDLSLAARHDDGSTHKTALAFNRATGLGTVVGDPTAALGIATKQYTDAAVAAGDALKVAKAGDTMSGDLTISKTTPILTLDATGTSFSNVYMKRAGVLRWILRALATEAGGNSGYDLELISRVDDGSAGVTALTFYRSTGLGVVAGNPTAALGIATKQYVDLKANIASPTFTGVPAAPTAAAGTNTTQLATTAFAKAASDAITSVPTGHRNVLRNGDMQIAQRGNGPFSGSEYTIDGWIQEKTGGTVNVTRVVPASGLGSPQYVCAVSGQSAAADGCLVEQYIEDVETFSGKTVTLSFTARALSGTPKIGIETDQYFGTGGSPSSSVYLARGTVTLSTTMTRYSMTFPVASISSKVKGSNNDHSLGVRLWLSAGTSNATHASSIGIQNNTFYITDVQLEEGPVATPFERLPIQQQLAWCQRYFCIFGDPLVNVTLGPTYAISTTASLVSFKFPVEMRAVPTMVSSPAATGFYINVGAGGNYPSSLSASEYSQEGGYVQVNYPAMAAAGQAGVLVVWSTKFICFIAEL